MKTDIIMNVTNQIQKHSPELLVGAGIAGMVVTTVTACKATTKLNDILEKHKEATDLIHETAESGKFGDEYTKKDAQKDIVITYRDSAIKLVKLYAPSVILGTLSIGCIVKGHLVLQGRNVALAAAYTAVDKGYKEYRSRVIDRFGENVDRELKYGLKAEKITETEVDEETGKEKKVKNTVDVCHASNDYSDYARFFDDASPCWKDNSEYNLMFLKGQQRYANDLLKTRGHVFLNEVYDMLGIPRTKAGQVVGWVYDPKNPRCVGDNYIDFGMDDPHRRVVRDFVNGYEDCILLDFNVDGPVWNLI